LARIVLYSSFSLANASDTHGDNESILKKETQSTMATGIWQPNNQTTNQTGVQENKH
jgi:hypothetical protein